MADEMISELTEQTNPQDNDFLAESNYTGTADPVTGSLYQSLKIKLITIYTYFKNKLLADGSCNKITTHTFTEAGYFDYAADRYEYISVIINSRKNLSNDEIKVGSVSADDDIMPLTTEKVIPVSLYYDSSIASHRVIRITTTGASTIKIISIIGL